MLCSIEGSSMVKLVPKGWIDRKPFNEPIDIFLPFKSTLPKSAAHLLQEDQLFTWPLLAKQLKTLDLKLVAVIDLLPHCHYYSVEEMNEAIGFIPYYKIGCKGGKNLPNDIECIFNRFLNTVLHIIQSKPVWKPNEFIGVHCAKGVNRTGFMICKYLITQKHWDPSYAIDQFSKRRDCVFNRPNYVEHLMQLQTASKSSVVPKVLETQSPQKSQDSSELKKMVLIEHVE